MELTLFDIYRRIKKVWMAQKKQVKSDFKKKISMSFASLTTQQWRELQSDIYSKSQITA